MVKTEAYLLDRQILYDRASKRGASPPRGRLSIPRSVFDDFEADHRVCSGTIRKLCCAAWELILRSPSTSVQHVNTDVCSQEYVGDEPLPLLTNYHGGSSDAAHLIQFQDTTRRVDSYITIGASEGLGDQMFRKQAISAPGGAGKFEATVQNPLKMTNYFFLLGNSTVPTVLKQILIERGYKFVDEPEELASYYDRLSRINK